MQVAGGNESAAGDALLRELSEVIEGLGEDETLTLAELTTPGVVSWTLGRDQNGTPVVTSLHRVPWASLHDQDGVLSEDKLSEAAGARHAAAVVCTAPYGLDLSRALSLLRAASPGVPVYHCGTPLDELIDEAIANAPLTRWYELVVVRRSPSGRLILGGAQLFPIGARRGDRWPFEIRSEPSEEGRVVFAVVASEPVRRFRLVSVESARLPAGSYPLTAELARPGVVRFAGLPGPLQPEQRAWSDLVASVPGRLERPQPSHLICVIEISGAHDQVQDRLSRVSQLIRRVATSGTGELKVSLLAYGPHQFGHAARDRDQREDLLEVVAWAENGENALAAIRRLRDRNIAVPGYPHAAQLECALAEVAERLDGGQAAQHGRPVLVAVGSRPPFPHKVDLSSGILPCPRRSDWRAAIQQLRNHLGMRFGAIQDGAALDALAAFPDSAPGRDAWAHLGSGAAARIDAFDVAGFAAGLGLAGSGDQHVPFPMVDDAEGG